jgi:hypothetical protein
VHASRLGTDSDYTSIGVDLDIIYPRMRL